MNVEQGLRAPNHWERLVLDRLCEAEFPGKDDLRHMLADLQVRVIDSEGSLKLRSGHTGRAAIAKSVPVEAQSKDRDDIPIYILLHVRDGRPSELEIYKANGSRIKSMPSPEDFEIIVLDS